MSEGTRTEICRNGKKYVTAAEFARRVDVSKMTISNALRDGRLEGTKLDGYKREWIEWQKQKEIWDDLQNEVHPGQPSKKRLQEEEDELFLPFDTGVDYTPEDGETIHVNNLRNLTELEDSIAEEKVEEVTFGDNTVNLSKVDIKYFYDCLLLDRSGKARVNPITNEPMIDWKKADVKVKTLIHQQQLDQKAGTLIELTEAEEFMSTAFSPVAETINNLPDKYFMQISAWLDASRGVKLSNKENSELRELLKDETDSMLRGLQSELMEVLLKCPSNE